MKSQDLVKNLELTTREFFLGVHNLEEGKDLLGFTDPAGEEKALSLLDRTAYVFKGNVGSSIGKTVFANSTESSKKMYYELQQKTFWIVVLEENDATDNLEVLEDYFATFEDACKAAEQALIK